LKSHVNTESPLQSLANALFFHRYTSTKTENAAVALNFASSIETLFNFGILASHERDISAAIWIQAEIQPIQKSIIGDYLEVLESIVEQDEIAKTYCPDLMNLRKVLSLPWPDLDYEHVMKSAKESQPLVISVQERLRYRRVFRSQKGLIGLCPGSSAEGDEIWLLPGGSTPFILRPLQNGHYMLLGEAYAYGIMYGEGLEWAEDAREIKIE
jgi:hypothetical protein